MKVIFRTSLLLFAIMISATGYTQADSSWSVIVLKKGHKPVIRDNMAGYSRTGFFLYLNCLYTFTLNDKQSYTGRLIDLKPDTLFFTLDENLEEKLTVLVSSIKYLTFSDNWTPNGKKNIKAKNHLFIFTIAALSNTIPSEFAYVTPDREREYELIPAPTLKKIRYYSYFEGHMFYHSGVDIEPPKYTDEEKAKTTEAVLTVLDILINKRVIISLEKKNK